MKTIRYIYGTVIILLAIVAAVSLWYYQTQADLYDKEQAALEQIGREHEAKVQRMEQDKK